MTAPPRFPPLVQAATERASKAEAEAKEASQAQEAATKEKEEQAVRGRCSGAPDKAAKGHACLFSAQLQARLSEKDREVAALQTERDQLAARPQSCCALQ